MIPSAVVLIVISFIMQLQGNQSHGPNAVKSKSPTSGDEGQTRKKAPNSSLPKAPIVQVSHGDAGVGSNVSSSSSTLWCTMFQYLYQSAKEPVAQWLQALQYHLQVLDSTPCMDIQNLLTAQSSRILLDLFHFYQKDGKNESRSSSVDATLLDDSK